MAYTVTELAKKLKMNRNVVLRHISAGILKAKRNGEENQAWVISQDNYMDYTQGIENPMLIKDFAKEIHKSNETIRFWIKNNRIRCAKIGGKWYIDAKEINNYI